MMLSGTPIVNYPNEVAVLFNMLRGYIYTFTFKIKSAKHTKLDTSFFTKLLTQSSNQSVQKIVDYIKGLNS